MQAGCPFFEFLCQVPPCPCAPGSFGLVQLMAPGMGLGAVPGHYLGSLFLSVLLCGRADELLSKNLTSAVRIHCICRWISKNKYFLKVLRIALY